VSVEMTGCIYTGYVSELTCTGASDLSSFCPNAEPGTSRSVGFVSYLSTFRPFVQRGLHPTWASKGLALACWAPVPRSYREGCTGAARGCRGYKRVAGVAAGCEAGEGVGLLDKEGCAGLLGVDNAVKGSVGVDRGVKVGVGLDISVTSGRDWWWLYV